MSTFRESFSTKSEATQEAQRYRKMGWKVTINSPKNRDINGAKGRWWIVGSKRS